MAKGVSMHLNKPQYSNRRTDKQIIGQDQSCHTASGKEKA